jgi:hypothetical protein
LFQIGSDRLVACAVSVGVVDRFEPVHIEEHDREGQVLARRQDDDGKVDHEVAFGETKPRGVSVATGLELLFELGETNAALVTDMQLYRTPAEQQVTELRTYDMDVSSFGA